MKKRELTKGRIEFLHQAAVTTVMRLGRFESSGPTKLSVYRRKDLMISYRTPFNPLPPLSEHAKYFAAKDGKCAHLKPYGIDIWQLDVGKVMSLGWASGEEPVVDLYRPGQWEHTLGTPRNALGRYLKLDPRSETLSAAEAGAGASSRKNAARASKGRAGLRTR